MRKIVITGASGGIGKAIALELIKIPETKILLISRDKSKLESILDQITDKESRLQVFPFDLLSADYTQLVNKITETLGTVDILINNAGAIVNKPFDEIDYLDFEKVINTNFRAPFFLIQKILPFFSEGSHIVNISSMGGFQGSVKFPGLSLYSASKGALSTLSEVLALEFREKDISVNCLAIGSVQTAMLEHAFPGYQSPVTASSMAEFISWFALNAHKWMNGKIIPVSISTP